MKFETWWRQTKPAEVDEHRAHFEDCWHAATEEAARKEREACAEACESVHVRPIQGAHEEYLAGKEMAIQQCARAIRRRCTDAP